MDAIQGPQEWQAFRARGLAQNEVTLAEILKKAGYATGAIVGGPWMKRIFGLDKGFDYYDDSEISTLNGRIAEQLTASAVAWIEKSRDKEFFLFLNYFDPHAPYWPPEGFAGAFLPKHINLREKQSQVEQWNDLYDAEILYMDHYLGQFIEKLIACNLYHNTWIIVTADHGELIGEHGKFSHGKDLFQEELHIPLLMKYPGEELADVREHTPVQLIDILPMILERLGIEIPEGIQGGVPPRIGHPLLAEVYPLPSDSKEGDWRAIYKGDFKFIWSSQGHHLLFDLTNDQDEENNLVTLKPKLASTMLSELNQYLANLPPPGPAPPAQELDENTKKALKSLGYVH
jgi:arylsulfatase A-like enzyme